MTQAFGRLDGFLVAVIEASDSGDCRADSGHTHLQIDGGDGVIDVAVNLDAEPVSLAHAPIDAWAQGWHPDTSFDYVRDLAQHAAAFPPASAATVASFIDDALANANHVSIYAKGYGTDGIHDVHRNGALKDGAIVVTPTEATATYLLFRFTDQAF